MKLKEFEKKKYTLILFEINSIFSKILYILLILIRLFIYSWNFFYNNFSLFFFFYILYKCWILLNYLKLLILKDILKNNFISLLKLNNIKFLIN